MDEVALINLDQCLPLAHNSDHYLTRYAQQKSLHNSNQRISTQKFRRRLLRRRPGAAGILGMGTVTLLRIEGGAILNTIPVQILVEKRASSSPSSGGRRFTLSWEWIILKNERWTARQIVERLRTTTR